MYASQAIIDTESVKYNDLDSKPYNVHSTFLELHCSIGIAYIKANIGPIKTCVCFQLTI